jgi:hypothetical protein
MRQLPIGFSRASWQSVGIAIPAERQASSTDMSLSNRYRFPFIEVSITFSSQFD